MPKRYVVYILSSETGVLYIGVTNDLQRRLEEHRHRRVAGFTRRAKTTRLVYFEETSDVRSAIIREKQLKDWRRARSLRSSGPATQRFGT